HDLLEGLAAQAADPLVAANVMLLFAADLIAPQGSIALLGGRAVLEVLDRHGPHGIGLLPVTGHHGARRRDRQAALDVAQIHAHRAPEGFTVRGAHVFAIERRADSLPVRPDGAAPVLRAVERAAQHQRATHGVDPRALEEYVRLAWRRHP